MRSVFANKRDCYKRWTPSLNTGDTLNASNIISRSKLFSPFHSHGFDQ